MACKGIYVHIPYCSVKCPYCDFVSVTRPVVDPEEYIDLLLKEARLYKDLEVRIETLYFGGGTPSLLKPSQIGRIVEGLSAVFDLSHLEEVSLECNPRDYSYGDFKELLKVGVNRLSIGVQSFTEKGLKVLGREHGVEDSVRTFYRAREAGFENINVDLIYAYPNQKRGDVEVELEFVERLAPDHVSAYMLTPHTSTPLGQDILGGRVSVPQEEELEEIYRTLWKGLKAIGYERYEISNWSKAGKECKHNLLYWKMEEFLGLGVSAWGFYGGKRYANLRNLVGYAKVLSEGKSPVEVEISLSERDLLEERIMLALRLKWGLSDDLWRYIPFHLHGFFDRKGDRYGIKEEFMLVANEIIAEVLSALEKSYR